MLAPFSGYLWAGPNPTARVEAAAIARRVRDAAGRYQQGYTPDPELMRPHFRRLHGCLVRYEVSGPSGLIYRGLVGLADLSDLRPHESTFHDAAERPCPAVAVRPLLAISERPLPETAQSGPSVVINDGRVTHRATPLESSEHIDCGMLMIADGHHRTKASLAAGVTRGMTLVVGDAGRGLKARAFHRRMLGVGDLPESADDAFEVTVLERPAPRAGALVWVDHRGSARMLKARSEALEALPESLREIPAAQADRLLDPLTGWQGGDDDYRATPDAVMRRLGPGDAALLMPEVGVPRIVRAALDGRLLPAKGTRFRPKPVRGMVVHTP